MAGDQGQSHVEPMAECIAAGLVAHMGTTWRWRVGLAATAAGGLLVLADLVAGLLVGQR